MCFYSHHLSTLKVVVFFSDKSLDNGPMCDISRSFVTLNAVSLSKAHVILCSLKIQRIWEVHLVLFSLETTEFIDAPQSAAFQ